MPPRATAGCGRSRAPGPWAGASRAQAKREPGSWLGASWASSWGQLVCKYTRTYRAGFKPISAPKSISPRRRQSYSSRYRRMRRRILRARRPLYLALLRPLRFVRPLRLRFVRLLRLDPLRFVRLVRLLRLRSRSLRLRLCPLRSSPLRLSPLRFVRLVRPLRLRPLRLPDHVHSPHSPVVPRPSTLTRRTLGVSSGSSNSRGGAAAATADSKGDERLAEADGTSRPSTHRRVSQRPSRQTVISLSELELALVLLTLVLPRRRGRRVRAVLGIPPYRTVSTMSDEKGRETRLNQRPTTWAWFSHLFPTRTDVWYCRLQG